MVDFGNDRSIDCAGMVFDCENLDYFGIVMTRGDRVVLLSRVLSDQLTQ